MTSLKMVTSPLLIACFKLVEQVTGVVGMAQEFGSHVNKKSHGKTIVANGVIPFFYRNFFGRNPAAIVLTERI